jgi:hypothetical protein
LPFLELKSIDLLVNKSILLSPLCPNHWKSYFLYLQVGNILFNALIIVLFWAVSGKECKSDTDCAGITNTTCMRHPDDTKMRCLCGEKKSPQNGACHHSKQGKQKCHVLICRDILVESIYSYFYEKELSL